MWALVVLAALLLLVSSLVIWIERQVLDTDNWVETSGQLLEDETPPSLGSNNATPPGRATVASTSPRIRRSARR